MPTGRRRSAQIKVQAGSQTVQPNTTRKWKKKVHRVEPGDIVQFHSNNMHMTGSTGTVCGYLTNHEVLIQTFGGSDTDYPPMYISMYDREPNENHAGNGPRHQSGNSLVSYACYITRVLYRMNPQPVKKKKKTPVRFLRVNPEVLPEVLSGEIPVDKGVHVVVDPDAPQVPEQIVAPQP